MLTERFVASTLDPEKPGNSTILGVHLYEFQPLPGLKHTFKKSSTNPNSLAVSSTHIFAAQADKAVVHVYSRERSNQEAVIPFPEKITCIALAGEHGGTGILLLGTENGRIILWELATGRQVSTPQHHLQAITCLAVDTIPSFLLSGSADATIHVWTLLDLVSPSSLAVNDINRGSPLSPLRSLSNHRAAITALAIGISHSRDNIAVSTSMDKTCVIWNYQNGELLHTFLLQSQPLCLTLDPVDRAAYAGYEDGSIQFIDFYHHGGSIQSPYTSISQSTPIQPPPAANWKSMQNLQSKVLCLQASYDGTQLLSGHQNGEIHTWDVAKGQNGKPLADFAAPVTNLQMLKPTGFVNTLQPDVKLINVTKPRYETFVNGNNHSNTTIPDDWTFTAQFTGEVCPPDTRAEVPFLKYKNQPFDPDLWEACVAECLAQQNEGATSSNSSDLADLQAELAALKAELDEQKKQDSQRQKDDEVKAASKKRRRLRRAKVAEVARKREMGETVVEGDEEINADDHEERDLSSSTDELTDS